MKKLSIALVCALIVPMFASVADARGRDKPDFHYEGTTKCWSNNTAASEVVRMEEFSSSRSVRKTPLRYISKRYHG